MFGVLAQFFYVGAQVCISSFFIRFAERVGGLEEKPAAYLFIVALNWFYDRAIHWNCAYPFYPACKIAGHLQS